MIYTISGVLEFKYGEGIVVLGYTIDRYINARLFDNYTAFESIIVDDHIRFLIAYWLAIAPIDITNLNISQ